MVLILIAATVAALVGGCAPREAEGDGFSSDKPKRGGTMSFYIGEPAYLDPYNAQESEGIQVTQVLFDSLTRLDTLDPSTIVPAAALSWEPNEDATVWTFHLNPNGRFSDGSRVTADDFVYAWNRVANPKTVSTSTGQPDPSVISYHLALVSGFSEVSSGKTDRLAGVRALDELTLEVTLAEPFADFEYVVAHPALAPVPAKYVEDGVEYGGEVIAYGEMPVGNGPFKMAEPWKHNQYITVERNDTYAGDAPYLDGVSFRIFRNPGTAYTEFQKGELDFTQIDTGRIREAETKYGLSADGYTSNPGSQVLVGAETATNFLAFNMDDEYLRNPHLRRAISLAINREAICDILYEGTFGPADNIVSPGVAGYEEGAWADARYDVDGAKAALVDAGYPDGEGLPPIRLSYYSGGDHQKAMEMMQADLKRIGIEAKTESLDASAYLKQLDEKKHQIARMSWVADYPVAHNFIYSLFDSKSLGNKSAYVNPAVDNAVIDAEKIADSRERLERFKSVNRMIAEDMPVAPLMFDTHRHVGSERLRDFVFGPMGLGDFSRVWLDDTEVR